MFDQKYKSIFQDIHGNEELKAKIKANMQTELDRSSTKSGKSNSRYRMVSRYAAVAATLFLVTIVAVELLGKERAKSPVVDGLTPPSVVQTPEPGQTSVRYSELIFAESMPVVAPIANNMAMDIVAPFTENILGESDAVIKGTVTKIRFKEYRFVIRSDDDRSGTKATRQSVIYEVRVDKRYYSTLPLNVGDTITIENDLHTYTSLADSVEKLNVNRQYILPLYQNNGEVYLKAETEKVEATEKLESNLSVIYPFAPQIEITKDGKYLFPDHWVMLINEKAKTVTMDIEEELTYYGDMKLREDSEFEADFQKIVDTYCTE